MNKWFNVFKPPGTEQVKEMYMGKVRLKITSANSASKANSDEEDEIEKILNKKMAMKRSGV